MTNDSDKAWTLVNIPDGWRTSVRENEDFRSADRYQEYLAAVAEERSTREAFIREAFSGGRLVQLWVGDVDECDDETFTANFFSTLTDGDSIRTTFRTDEVLTREEAERLEVGTMIEWYVFEGEDTYGKFRGRRVRRRPPVVGGSH